MAVPLCDSAGVKSRSSSPLRIGELHGWFIPRFAVLLRPGFSSVVQYIREDVCHKLRSSFPISHMSSLPKLIKAILLA